MVNDVFLQKGVEPDFYETLDSVSTAVSFFQQSPLLDLIFLDIQLSDGLSFEIFQEVNVKTPIIFTTAFDEYALKAFQVHSIDYLLKPIEEQALKRSLDKFFEAKSAFGNSSVVPPQNTSGGQASNNTESTFDIEGLLQTLSIAHKTYKSRFLVPTGTGFLSIQVQEIAYFFSEHKITWLLTFDGKKYPIDTSLEDLILLLNPQHFFRANRQFILNITSIHAVHNSFNSKLSVRVKPNAPDEIIIGREKAREFKEWLDS
jgi:DNA-binding LytR/AlgR family response regulator